MRLWVSILAVFVAVTVLKASGPLAVGERQLPEPVTRVIEFLAPALLAGVVTVALMGHHWDALNATQVAGVAVAVVLRITGLPILACVASGVITTALIRMTI